MKTRIISAFPGTGKSSFYKKYTNNTLDSDSINFSWIEKNGEKVRNPDFPNNYINHIKENIGKYQFILVSSHKEVRDALKDNCIFFYLIYPNKKFKLSYIQRYKERGNNEDSIKLLNKNWDVWIDECYHEVYGCKNICMNNYYLETEIDNIINKENEI